MLANPRYVSTYLGTTINTKPLVFRSRLKSRVKREYLRRTSEYLTLPYDNEPASWSTGVNRELNTREHKCARVKVGVTGG